MKQILALAALAAAAGCGCLSAEIPRLQRVGGVTQLFVDARPVLLRAGETDNSSGEPEVMAESWKNFADMNMNAVVTPVYWEVIEPREGVFDWAGVDGVIEGARAHGMRIVFLWFGSWKNSMSCYAPGWVKADTKRFPRAMAPGPRPIEMLSAFSGECLKADKAAFAALMKHIRAVDEGRNTVVMVQVENEVGMVETERDRSPEADAAWAGPVPQELLEYLKANRDSLSPKLRVRWIENGEKPSGTWEEVFGKGSATEELFMAWHFALYTGKVAAAGKAEYALPMYTNAALIRHGAEPGQYPSAGPLPHLYDVWRAAAPALDFLSPDIYFTNFTEWADAYKIPGNAHFIPETLRSPVASVNALYAFGQCGSMGYSPYGINFISGQSKELLGQSYDLVRQLEPLILSRTPKGDVAACVPLGPEQRAPRRIDLGGIRMFVSFQTFIPPALADGVVVAGEAKNAGAAIPAGCLLIRLSDEEILIGGMGVTIFFTAPGGNPPAVGLKSVEEGRFDEAGNWVHLAWLNGDQTNQGRQVILPAGRFSLQRVKLYCY
jgi:hypothetical protein